MTLVSNDPSSWPQIAFTRTVSYFVVASSTAVVYDWISTFGQEVELLWRKKWSLVTFLYLSLRYIGLLFSVPSTILPSDRFDDRYGTDVNTILRWMLFVTDIVLGAIMIIRLHAMYQRSRKMLVFLIATYLAVAIASSVMSGVGSHPFTWEESVLSGTYLCIVVAEDQFQLLTWTWVIGTAWEALTLCLAVRIAVQHFREINRLGRSTTSTIGDCFTVLIKSQVLHFTAFAAVSCFNLGYFSQNISTSISMGAQIYNGIIMFVLPVQQFVLGPRLILSVREYYAQLVDNSDAGTGITTIAFQEGALVSTSSSV
ncbi:hypothetical protein BDR03DRAFT_620144 [Suillus americanus]|nr:hypothetical protein BDR03DRAFT_620144 [Suillus americanus]